jgi:uncharacterized protein (DUF302 family)
MSAMTSAPLTAGDLVEHLSAFGFEATVQRLAQAIAAAGLQVFATVDHAAGAKTVSLSMPPTVVILYGHPKGGTPIMQAYPDAALDLPLRVLVREREDDARTVVAFHPMAPLLARVGVPAEMAGRLEPAQQLLIAAIGG